MGYIYIITNDVNGKKYVGKTEYFDPSKRWKEHLNDYKKKRCEKRPIYDAMNKYGIDHFHFEIIEETENTCEREQYWIQKLRTYVGFDDCNGYNATLGGDGKKYLNLNEDEVVEYHINQANYSIGYTAKEFKVDIYAIKQILLKHNIGWKTSLETKKDKYGLVYCVDSDNKRTICSYDNASEAAKENDRYNSSTIGSAASGNKAKNGNISHKAYGLYWYRDRNLPDYIIKN